MVVGDETSGGERRELLTDFGPVSVLAVLLGTMHPRLGLQHTVYASQIDEDTPVHAWMPPDTWIYRVQGWQLRRWRSPRRQPARQGNSKYEMQSGRAIECASSEAKRREGIYRLHLFDTIIERDLIPSLLEGEVMPGRQ